MLAVAAAAEAGVRLLSPRPGVDRVAGVDLRSYFSGQDIARGAAYARPQALLALARVAAEVGVLRAVTRRPPSWLARRQSRPVLAGALTGGGLAVVLTVVAAPLAAVSRRRAIAVGLVTQTWRGWGLDLLKSTGIETGLAAGAGATITAAIRRFPRTWWVLGAGGSVLFGASFAALAPVLLDPLFNDYTPLEDGQTRADVLALARAAGLTVKEVYAVDASRRTTAANAYVTGLGPTKRVVLFDTLLDRYGRDEVRVVVAHELAHVRNRDVARGVAFAAIVVGPSAFAVKRLAEALGSGAQPPATLPALALATAFVSTPVGIIANRLSRAVERRADAFSLELTGATDAFVSFERKIALQNVADLDPPWWSKALLASHPTTAERIAAAVEHDRRPGSGA